MKAGQSRWLVVAGLGLMVIGVVDPMEGSLVILGGSFLVAVAAVLSRTRYRLPMTALVLIGAGVGAMFGLSVVGGVGGNTGRSMWWLLLCAPYPIGWILGLIGAASKLRELRNAPA
jgi:hypothetical protein